VILVLKVFGMDNYAFILILGNPTLLKVFANARAMLQIRLYKFQALCAMSS